MNVRLIYQDESLLIADKPAGVATVPGGWEKDAPSLLAYLAQDYGRLWIVHRLDKVTSGLVVFARTAEAHRSLSLLFESHQVYKTYHALVNGNPEWMEYLACHPLRVNVGHRHRTIVDPRNGKTAETAFRLLERFSGYALLEALPATGRTHQVRVHAYALGFPLLGDTLYSAPATELIGRPALHAHSLTFPHPSTGERLAFKAPYPEDFESALNRLRAGR